MKRIFLSLILLDLFFLVGASAQTRSSDLEALADPRGAPELIVCSQNLENYGKFSDFRVRMPEKSQTDFEYKQRALIQRFISTGCDVIAVQEILAKGDLNADEVLKGLALLLRKSSGRFFESKIGTSDDPMLRVGFLVAKDRAEIMNSTSYNNVELPKISEKEKPRGFARGPLEIQLSVKGMGDATSKPVTLVNFHFKSKRGGVEQDPAQLEWETYRMEMAEALRRVLVSRHARSFQKADSILITLGDRNSNFDVASAKILDGTLTLKMFQEQGACRLSKRGVPLCAAEMAKPPKLFSVLTGDAETKGAHGTFVYEKVYSWLDEILMPAESLRYAWAKYDTAGNYDSGVVSEPKDASDHSLVWVKLNW